MARATPKTISAGMKSSASVSTSRKRKAADLDDEYTSTPSKNGNILALDNDTPAKSTKKAKKQQEEKRARIFRKQAPKTFLEKLARAQSQRMIVVGRTRHSDQTEDGTEYPTEDIDIVGSTGNIYTVSISKEPSCTCPDSQKGHECKHKVYALSTVLKAPEHLVYQVGLLSTELREIFEGGPPIPTDTAEAEDKDGKRKSIEGECPICYMDLDEQENDLVWCKAACGNNMHKSCFEQWVASQRGNTVKCVYCRTPWEMEVGDLKGIEKGGIVGPEGYVNVADQFGMSTQRDYSTYHQHWVRRTLGMGF